jgi:outer membrane receptor protein involved in Fe transport
VQHNFGETGFGIMANLTVVDSDAELDVTDLNQSFALTGLSNSKNLVAYYEKYGVQLRLAYNQRDGFLQSLSQPSGGTEPTFVEDYHQFDFSGSYDFNEHLTVFFEGTNITGEETLKHGRYSNQFLLAQDTGPRYALGVRATF